MKMNEFKQIFDKTKTDNGWNSQRTAEYYADQLNRSVATIYRYLGGRCPDTILRLVQAEQRPKLSALVQGIIKKPD